MKDDSNKGVRQFVTPTGVLSLNVVLAKTYDSNQDPTLTYIWKGDGNGIETNVLSWRDGTMFNNKPNRDDMKADQDKDVPIKDLMNNGNEWQE